MGRLNEKRCKNRKRKSKKIRRGGDPDSGKIYKDKYDYIKTSIYKPNYKSADDILGIQSEQYYRVRGGNDIGDQYRKYTSTFNNKLATSIKNPLLKGALFNARGTASALWNVYNNTDKTKNSSEIFRETLRNSPPKGYSLWIQKNFRDNLTPHHNISDVHYNYGDLIKKIEETKIDKFKTYLENNHNISEYDVKGDALADIIKETEKDAMPDKTQLEQYICDINNKVWQEADTRKTTNTNYNPGSFIDPSIEELLKAQNLTELYSKIETMKDAHIARMPLPYQLQLNTPNYDPATKFQDNLPSYCDYKKNEIKDENERVYAEYYDIFYKTPTEQSNPS